MIGRGLDFLVVLWIVVGCVTAPCDAGKPAPQNKTSSLQDTARPSSVDAVFQRYRQKLPKATTLSEQNGATIQCDRHGWATLTLLSTSAAKVPITEDRDLVALVPWLRDKDKCIRQIALEVLIPKIGFDRNLLVIPNMFDPEHVLYHEIFVAFKTYLDAKKVTYDPAIFDGLFLTVSQSDFPALLYGQWAEDTEGRKLSFEQSLDVDAQFLKAMQREMHGDPKWPMQTWTTKIKDVRVTERGQFVVTGAWDVESTANGYQGPKHEPSQFVYTFWMVKTGVVWLSEQHTPGSWRKFRKGR